MRFISFSEIMGQERAKKFLKGVMARDKIPHAYLFTGISGVGKASTASALALALNCREPVAGDSCGQCPSCRQLKGGNAPDFTLIEPDGQAIKIDQIRELNRSLGFAPISGRYRLCFMKRSETMTDEAANAFLKTLEEPPPGNILILSATEPRDLLQTIVSRCQRVAFQPLCDRDITRWLTERKGLKEDMALAFARISAGSLGRALKMCESDFFEKRQEWILRLIKLPDFTKENTIEAALDCAGEPKKGLLDGTESDEAGLLDMLGIWKSWYRDLLLLKAGGGDHLLMNMDFSHKLKNLAKRFTISAPADSLLLLDKAERDLRRQRNRILVMENLLFGLRRLAGEGHEILREKIGK